jgi:hypothetical protein
LVERNKETDLARLGSDLGGRALGALLSLDATSTILDGLLAGGLTGLRALRAALLDHIKGSTDDGTLSLHNTAGTLLGNLL